MSKALITKLQQRSLRAGRVRAKIFGTEKRPRLSVHVSNRHVVAQLVDDTVGRTLAYATTTSSKSASGTMTEQAAWVGSEIARKAKSIKIKKVVFDRGSKLYHGRVKALADAARNSGLEF